MKRYIQDIPNISKYIQKIENMYKIYTKYIR